MANEINVTLSLSAYKAAIMASAIGRSVTGAQFTMSGSFYVEGTISVATSATLIPLGQVVAPHWAFLHNLDAANFVKLRNGAAGADLIKLLAGEYALVPLYDSATPYAIADTAACLLEYLILSL